MQTVAQACADKHHEHQSRGTDLTELRLRQVKATHASSGSACKECSGSQVRPKGTGSCVSTVKSSSRTCAGQVCRAQMNLRKHQCKREHRLHSFRQAQADVQSSSWTPGRQMHKSAGSGQLHTRKQESSFHHAICASSEQSGAPLPKQTRHLGHKASSMPIGV